MCQSKYFNIRLFYWFLKLLEEKNDKWKKKEKKEASYFDRINMTKNRLEYDQKIITPTNMNDGAWPKDYTDEHEQLNMTEIPINFGHIIFSISFSLK